MLLEASRGSTRVKRSQLSQASGINAAMGPNAYPLRPKEKEALALSYEKVLQQHKRGPWSGAVCTSLGAAGPVSEKTPKNKGALGHIGVL